MARRRTFRSEEPSGAAAGLDRSAVTGALRIAVSPFGQLMGMAPTHETWVMKTANCPRREIWLYDHRRPGDGTVPVILPGSGVALRNQHQQDNWRRSARSVPA